MAPPVLTLVHPIALTAAMSAARPEAGDLLLPLPLAGLGGAKVLILLVIVALPAILVVGSLLRRRRSR